MANKFWESHFQRGASGEAPALTIDEQQARELEAPQLQKAKAPEQAPPAPEPEGASIADVGLAAASGLVGWGESMQEIAASPEKQRMFTGQVPGMVSMTLAQYVPAIREHLGEAAKQGREAFNTVQETLKTSMTKDARKALESEIINENLEFTDDAARLSTWIMKGTETIARMVPDLVLGGMGANAIYKEVYDTALQNGLSKGLSQEGARIAADKIAKSAMTAPMAATSTASATGSAGVQAREAIESMPWNELTQSDTFKQQFAAIDQDPKNEGLTDQQKLNMARTATADIASSKLMNDPALLAVNAMASTLGDATLGKLLTGKIAGGIVSKAATGAIAEAPTEAAQSAMEQYAQNLMLIDVAGQDVDPMKGVKRAAAEGGLLGGAVGGTVGGTVGAVDKVTGRESQPLEPQLEGPEIIPEEVATIADGDLKPGAAPEPLTVAERRAALNEKLAAQQEQLRRERVLAGTGEVQEALSKGQTAPTPIELIAQAKEQAKVQRDEFVEGRAAPTVAERRANLKRRLEQQSAEYAKQQAEAGKGPVQERLSMPTSPTVDELLIKASTETGPSPYELEYRKQAERDYIEKVKDAAIPQGLKGKPNAVKLLNKGYRNAITDFGGLSEQLSKTTYPDPKTDTMAEVIGKMGGIGRATAESEGFDPAMFKGSKTFSANGKMTFDDAAEKLNELGYRNRQGDTLDSNDVVDMLYGEINNTENHYSTHVDPKMLTADAQIVRTWAKALGGADKLSATIKKSLAGERLGKRQAEVMEDMLDSIAAMRSEGAEQAKQTLDARRSEREAKRIESFNSLMAEATGNKSHIADIDSYNRMLSEKPEYYSEEQVILDELVATAGDIDFNATSEAIDLYESGKTSLPNLLTKLSDIAHKRERTYAEAKPAIQAVSKPTTQPIEGVVTERVAESEGAPAAGLAEVTNIDQRKDGSATTVSDAGLTLLHGSPKSVINIDDVQIVRTGQKQGKKGRLYGGFYATSEEDIEQAKGYAGMSEGTPTIHNVRIKAGTKVLNKIGDITRLSENYINELTSQGYGLVVGKDPRGRTEYVVIDKNAIDSISSMDSVKDKTDLAKQRDRRHAELEVKQAEGLVLETQQKIKQQKATGGRTDILNSNLQRQISGANRIRAKYGLGPMKVETKPATAEVSGAEKAKVVNASSHKTVRDKVLAWADIKSGMKVLEPSAGNGELATAAQRLGADVDTVELAADLREILKEKGFNVLGDDFLEFKSAPDYDRILMNPPFSNDQDIDHIAHAFNMLKTGGRLVAITSAMAGDRANSKNRRFREWLDNLGAEEQYLPDDAFMQSMNPTGVKTKTIIIDKPEDAKGAGDEPEMISFSKDSVVTGNPTGVNAKEADIAVKAFMKRYKGAAGVKVLVFPTQQEALSYAGIDAPEGATIGGMHIPMTGEVIIVAENMHDIGHVTKTLRHEILAHHGLISVVGMSEWEAVTNLVSASREASSLKEVWAEVDRDYREFSEDRKAEEVIARIAEGDTGKFGEWGNRIMAAVIRAMRRVGFISDKITKTEIQDMIRIIGERMKNVSKAEVKMRSDINYSRQLMGNSGFTIPDETRTDAFLRTIADKYQRLKVVQRELVAQGGKVTEATDVYLKEELFHGKVGEDLRIMEADYIQPLQEYMAANDVDIAELDLYLIANHAPERNAQIAKINPGLPDGGSGMTNQEAADILAKFNTEGKTANLDAASKYVYGMLAMTKNRLIDSGLETQDAVDSWDATYSKYVPLKGFAVDEADTDGNSVKAVGKGFNIRGKETMRAMGRRSLPNSPTAFAISDATQSMVRARKNEVGQSLLKLVDANPDANLWNVYSNDNPDITRRIVRKKDPLTGKKVEEVIEFPMPMHAMKDQYLGVKMSGEQYYIKLEDKRLMEAMANLGVEQSNVLTQTVGRMTRLLSALITSYNPEFMFSNFARDVQTAVYNLMAETEVKGGKAEGLKGLPKQVIKDLPSSMAALRRGFRENEFTGEFGKYLKEYLEAGAKTGWFVQKDIDEIKADFQKVINRTGPGAKNAIARGFTKFIKFVDDYNDVVENASRLSTYVNARRQGLTEQQAATLAKNLTVNFNRRGQMSNTINALYMFFNASVQGTANMLRAVATPKDKSKSLFNPSFYNTTQKIAMALPIATMFMAAANRELGGDDDDGKAFYDKIPSYLKETNFILMIPGSDGDYIKIPMPYGYNFFSAVGTAIDNSINGEASAVEGAFDIAAAFAGAFSPLGRVDSDNASVQMLKMMSPTLMKPFVEMSVNENFSGSPIYKEQNPFGLQTPDAYNAQRRTWEWAKGLSEWLNDATGGNQFKSGIVDIAPESWRHMASFMGGGLGSLAGKTQDLAAKTIKDEKIDSKDVPFWRKYFGSISDSVDVAEFYQRLQKMQEIEKQATELPPSERAAFRKDNKALISLVPMATATKKELQKISKYKSQIEASKSMSDETKKARIEKLEEKKRMLASRFNARYNKAINP
ncbi:MAG: LPD38 domain-containing protein [Shewanella sp.]